MIRQTTDLHKKTFQTKANLPPSSRSLGERRRSLYSEVQVNKFDHVGIPCMGDWEGGVGGSQVNTFGHIQVYRTRLVNVMLTNKTNTSCRKFVY